MEFDKPAARLAEDSFFFEIFELLDLTIEPTAKPRTIIGKIMGISGMVSAARPTSTATV
jgi:hypothetical protein